MSVGQLAFSQKMADSMFPQFYMTLEGLKSQKLAKPNFSKYSHFKGSPKIDPKIIFWSLLKI